MSEIGNEIKKLGKNIGKFFFKFFKWKMLVVLVIVAFLILVVFTWWGGVKISASTSGQAAKVISENVYTEGSTIKTSPEMYTTIRQTVEDKGLDPDSLYLGEEYEYLQKMVQAELVTNYTVDFTIEGTDKTGIIEIRRKLLDQTDIKLEYLVYEDFEAKFVNKDDNIKNYYTIDSDFNIVVAKVNVVTTTDANGNVTQEKEYLKESMPYRTLVSQYTMPFEYLYILMETTMNPEYVSAVAELALKESNIVFTVFDSVTKTTTVTEEEYKERNHDIIKTYRAENLISTNVGDYTYSETRKDLVQTVVEEINTITSGITKVDTWLYKKDVDYAYKQEPPNTIQEGGENRGSAEEDLQLNGTTYNEKILSAANWLTQVLRNKGFKYDYLTDDNPYHPMINSDQSLTANAIYKSGKGAYCISCATFVTETLYHAGILKPGAVVWATYGSRSGIISTMKSRYATRGVQLEEVSIENALPGDILHYNASSVNTCHICILTEINSGVFKKTGSPEFIYPGSQGGEFREINNISDLNNWIILRVTNVTN